MHCTKCGLESTVCCCPVFGGKPKPTAKEVYLKERCDDIHRLLAGKRDAADLLCAELMEAYLD